MRLERIRTQKETTERLRIANEFSRGELLNRAELERVFDQLADALVSAVMASPLDRQVKENCLRNIAGWPQIVLDVANKQTRAHRANGPSEEEDES